MNKTPEEMAEEFFAHNDYNEFSADEVFAIGYKAAQDQIADADKVMNSPEKPDGWISVKDRLPNLEKTRCFLRRESSCILLVSYGNVYVAHLCEDWTDRSHFIFEACDCGCHAHDMEKDEWKLDQVTHWMPLPAPPKEEK